MIYTNFWTPGVPPWSAPARRRFVIRSARGREKFYRYGIFSSHNREAKKSGTGLPHSKGPRFGARAFERLN